MKRRLMLLAVGLAAALLPLVAPDAHAAEVNVAQGRPVTASSVESAGLPATNAVDGNAGTRWSSAFAAAQWIQVDLGAPTAVSRVEIAWEAAYAKAFSVRFSTDGTTYTQAYATTAGTGGVQSVAAAGTARYVRLELTTRALAAYGYSIWELRVYSGTAPAGPLTGVTLIDDTTRAPVAGFSPIADNAVIDPGQLPNRTLSIRADIAAGMSVGSVAFTLTPASGAVYTRTENTAPYFLCNDYVDCPQLVTPGAYTLTVQAAGQVLTVHFTVAGATVDVLFVGNSLIGTATAATGADTPTVTASLAASAGRSLRVTKVIHFGNTLQQTWDAGEVAAAVTGTARYDFVVLQEYSNLVATNLPAASATLLNTYAPKLAPVLKPGGKVVLFKNWATVDPAPFASRAAYVSAINANYATLSSRLTLANTVAPVSDTFETLIASRGTSYLIVADGKHPNDTAIYLNAATLYGILFRQNPRTLTANLYLTAATATTLRDTSAAAMGY